MAERQRRRGTSKAGTAVEVAGVRVSSPDKVLWPADGITKLELARYYERVAPTMLEYARGRPITMRPFPRGIEQAGFYVKNAPQGTPSWLETFCDVAESTGEAVHFVVADDARALVWIAQYNSIEVHAWLSTVDRPDCPDWAVVDLDPPDHLPEERRRDVVEAARAVRAGLERRGLRSFPKLSGQSGLHVLVPLAPVHPFDDVRRFFQDLATELCREHPDRLTTDYEIAGRGDRILIDYAQNARAKTTVAPYSVRPKPGAPVAVPVTWDELADPGFFATRWTIRDVPERLERDGDALAPARALKQQLPAPSSS